LDDGQERRIREQGENSQREFISNYPLLLKHLRIKHRHYFFMEVSTTTVLDAKLATITVQPNSKQLRGMWMIREL